MTPTNLLKDLSAEICAATSDLRLPTEYMREPEEFVPIQIFEQYIPADLFEETTYFPCVVVELLSVRDDLKDGSTAEIGLSFGVYAKEADGWRDSLHLAEIVRQRLLIKRTIGERYRLCGEGVLSFPDEQPTPFFFCYYTVQYEIYQSQEEGFNWRR